MERFQTAAGCSPLADKIKVAGLEVSYWPPRDPSQRFYWLNLHFVSTHIAEGGPPRILAKMGFFLEQKFMDGNLFSLAGTVIDRFAAEADLTLSYLYHVDERLTAHRATHKSLIYVQLDERNHGNLIRVQSTSAYAEELTAV